MYSTHHDSMYICMASCNQLLNRSIDQSLAALGPMCNPRWGRPSHRTTVPEFLVSGTGNQAINHACIHVHFWNFPLLRARPVWLSHIKGWDRDAASRASRRVPSITINQPIAQSTKASMINACSMQELCVHFLRCSRTQQILQTSALYHETGILRAIFYVASAIHCLFLQWFRLLCFALINLCLYFPRGISDS